MAAPYGGGFSQPGRDRSRSPRQGQPGGAGPSTEEINKLVLAREQARLSKDWGQADNLRDRLKAFGVTLYDKTNSWSCMDGRSGQIPTFNDIQSGRPAGGAPSPQMQQQPQMQAQMPQMQQMPGMAAPDQQGGMQLMQPPPLQMPAGMPAPGMPAAGDAQQQPPAMAPPAMGGMPDGGMAGMGGMPNMMGMPGMSMPTMAAPPVDGQAVAPAQPGADAASLAMTAPAATDPAAAAAAPAAMPGMMMAGAAPGATDMTAQYAQMAGMQMGVTDPAQQQQLLQLQMYQQMQMQQMQLLQQQALAAMAMPGLGGLAGVGAPAALPAAKSSSPDVQTALGIMQQVKAAGRAPSDAELNWLVEAREKVRKAKDWTGGDELRAAMKNYFGVEFLEKEKRWKSADGREGLIPMWSSLP